MYGIAVSRSSPYRATCVAMARLRGFRTTKNTRTRYAARPITRGTAQPQLNAPFTSSEIAPRIIHPETSSIAAAPMVSAAVRVCDNPSSMKMRPRIGMAVIDMATAKNSWKPNKGTASDSRA